MVGRDHLFKRSMVLVKAWCYFESHILSSQNGLLATYALETLVLCVVNLFHSELNTPLEVLAKFLDYFANFDWIHWTLTIRGPVHKTLVVDGGEVPQPRDKPGLLLTDSAVKDDAQLAALMDGLKDDNRMGFQVKYCDICGPRDAHTHTHIPTRARTHTRAGAYFLWLPGQVL